MWLLSFQVALPLLSDENIHVAAVWVRWLTQSIDTWWAFVANLIGVPRRLHVSHPVGVSLGACAKPV